MYVCVCEWWILNLDHLISAAAILNTCFFSLHQKWATMIRPNALMQLSSCFSFFQASFLFVKLYFSISSSLFDVFFALHFMWTTEVFLFSISNPKDTFPLLYFSFWWESRSVQERVNEWVSECVRVRERAEVGCECDLHYIDIWFSIFSFSFSRFYIKLPLFAFFSFQYLLYSSFMLLHLQSWLYKLEKYFSPLGYCIYWLNLYLARSLTHSLTHWHTHSRAHFVSFLLLASIQNVAWNSLKRTIDI